MTRHDKLRHLLYDVTNLPGMRWFDTCKWVCQPTKRPWCIYPPACRAPFWRERLIKATRRAEAEGRIPRIQRDRTAVRRLLDGRD